MISPEAIRFRSAEDEDVESLSRQDPSLLPLLCELLVSRGHKDIAAVERYFEPSEEAIHSPGLLRHMDKAVSLLQETLEAGQKILIHGDYDCDGICATSVLMQGLSEIGADVDYHLPDRFKEGYGLSMLAVERCIAENIPLLITVDCGSSSHQAIEAAKEAGIKVIVTDHHKVPTPAPEPDALVNPQHPDDHYPFKGLSGTGIAFKLLQALRGQSGAEPFHLLDLVALATIADVVPLVEENRVLVQLGLSEIGRAQRTGLVALMEVAGRSGREVVDSFTIGFGLGPRLNAAGRLEHAKVGVELMLSRSLAEARQISSHLDRLNEARKDCEREISDQIADRIKADPELIHRGAIVEWGEGWHEGVLGITAGRFAQKYGVPVLVIGVKDGRAKGSGRSPENVDLYAAMKQCGSLFQKFGGHPRAGGFSLEAANLTALREQMIEAANQLRDGPAPVWVDASLNLPQADLSLVSSLEQMEPFGEANPKPKFLLQGVTVTGHRLVGKSGDHLQLELEQGGVRRRAIAFRQGPEIDELKIQDFSYDLVCELGQDVFRGQEQLKIQVQGILRPPAQNEPDPSLPLLDCRHVLRRRPVLEAGLRENPNSVAICSDLAAAQRFLPEFEQRFAEYGTELSAPIDALILLSPPESMRELDELLQNAKPRRVTVLFGTKELDRFRSQLLGRSWDRNLAVQVWKHLLKKPALQERRELAYQGLEQGRLCTHRVATEILEAFQETEALTVDSEGRLKLGRGNGQKLEDTRVYREQKARFAALSEVRRFFAAPVLADHWSERWPELTDSARSPEGLAKESPAII